jgi:transaldolase
MEATKMNSLHRLKALGQSVWIDDFRRAWLSDGTLDRLIAEDGVTGVTSNPAIFAKAITKYDDYDEAIATLTRSRITAAELYGKLVVEDIRAIADRLHDAWRRSERADGYVSLEVSPQLAHDSDATVAEGRRLWSEVARPNLMIKVPATEAGLPAIRRLIASGVNVNVTLLFSVRRYCAVAGAYVAGLEDRQATSRSGHPPASVASFFLSRIDSWVDRRLDEIGTPGARALRGKAAIACARLAFQEYQQRIATPRWRSLADARALPQRLLWASTSTKDETYRDVRYVEALIAPHTINTMPVKTLAAFRDHGEAAQRIEEDLETARTLPGKLAALGIDLEEVAQRLETDGVRKFVEPHEQLMGALERRASQSGGQQPAPGRQIAPCSR